MNQYRLVTIIARTTSGTHNPRISAQTVTLSLREIGEIPPYTMYVLYAAILFWPSISDQYINSFVYWVVMHAFLSSVEFFQNQLFFGKKSGILSECQTVWIQIRPEICKILSRGH